MNAQGRLSRRNFLIAAGAGGVTTAAALVATTQGGKRPEKRAAAPELGKGYQLTAHIRNYYRTAKV